MNKRSCIHYAYSFSTVLRLAFFLWWHPRRVGLARTATQSMSSKWRARISSPPDRPWPRRFGGDLTSSLRIKSFTVFCVLGGNLMRRSMMLRHIVTSSSAPFSPINGDAPTTISYITPNDQSTVVYPLPNMSLQRYSGAAKRKRFTNKFLGESKINEL